MKHNVKSWLQSAGDNLLHWRWTKAILYWIIISAGVGSELAFLFASLWMSINASVHKFVLLFIDEVTTSHLSEMATMAYVALPECILALAITTTLSHARLVIYNKKDYASLVWSILYGVPTLVFLALSLITIGCSMVSINFQLPPFMIVTRGLAGFIYGLVALLYWQLGTQQEADRLKEKDIFVDQLQERIRLQTARTEVLNAEIENLKRIVAESQNQLILFQNEIKKGTDEALQAYGEDCVKWLFSDLKTVSIDDINRYTGHSKQKIAKAKLRRSSRNPDLIITESVIEWLKETPPPMRVLHVVGD